MEEKERREEGKGKERERRKGEKGEKERRERRRGRKERKKKEEGKGVENRVRGEENKKTGVMEGESEET